MRITGFEPDAWIEFNPHPEISARSFGITAVQGDYRMTIDSVTLLETASFLADIAKFERARDGIARLPGTYDFELTVERHGQHGAALVRFHMSHRVPVVGTIASQCRLDGVVVVPGEGVGALAEGFGELLRSCS
jgi:hypothetical protein